MPPTMLVASSDVIGPLMAGSGMRMWEIANVVARQQPVVLATPGSFAPPTADPLPPNLQVKTFAWGDNEAIRAMLPGVDAIVGQGFVLTDHPCIFASGLPIAADLATPLLLEALELFKSDDPQSAARHRRYTEVTQENLTHGDFFFCASERQRDYWLGALTALGRIGGPGHATDPTFHDLIDVVPFGFPTREPRQRADVFAAHGLAIAPDDVVLLWAGGLWDWLDPQIVIRAVAALAPSFPQLKLVFCAGARPNPGGDPFRMATYDAVCALVEELNVGRQVLFIDEWIPYDDRDVYLTAADLGVCAHRRHIETRFAFRTRLIDHLWAGLPTITSDGDSMAHLVNTHGWGLTVPPGDLPGWIAAIRGVLDQPQQLATFRDRLCDSRDAFRWDRVVAPVARWCLAPTRTAARHTRVEEAPAPPPVNEVVAYVARIEAAYRAQSAAYRELEAYTRSLENTIGQIQGGRIMRFLNRISRGRG